MKFPLESVVGAGLSKAVDGDPSPVVPTAKSWTFAFATGCFPPNNEPWSEVPDPDDPSTGSDGLLVTDEEQAIINNKGRRRSNRKATVLILRV